MDKLWRCVYAVQQHRRSPKSPRTENQKLKTGMPALSQSRTSRFALVIAMYFAQGIQIGLLVFALPAYMAAQDISALVIGGFISAVTLPWTL